MSLPRVVRREQLGIIAERRINSVPGLLVEVVAPGTLRQDTKIKRAAYARAGVPEYWLVRPTERDVPLHSQPDPALGAYLQTGHIPPDGTLASPTLSVCAAISAFFAGSPDETGEARCACIVMTAAQALFAVLARAYGGGFGGEGH